MEKAVSPTPRIAAEGHSCTVGAVHAPVFVMLGAADASSGRLAYEVSPFLTAQRATLVRSLTPSLT